MDLFAASFAITDHLFLRNLEGFFNRDYKFKIIIINYGFHHGFSVKCTFNEEVYRIMYQKLIDICRQLCDRIIVMTGTSYMQSDHLDQMETAEKLGFQKIRMLQDMENMESKRGF